MRIAADCHPALGLVEGEGAPLLGTEVPGELTDLLTETAWKTMPAWPDLEALTTDGLGETLAGFSGDPWPDKEDLALLQYTSGSTSTPKGVTVTHGAIMANFEATGQAMALNAESICVSWLPVFHDLGLFGGFLQTILNGGQSIILPPSTIVRDPLRWLQAVSDHGATVSGGPNFAFDACVEALARAKAKGRPLPEMDLSSLEVVFNGAEPVRATTLSRFVEAFAPFGLKAEALYPTYGMAEATLTISTSRPGALPMVRRYVELDHGVARRAGMSENEDGERSIALVSSGWPVKTVDLLVVDPQTHGVLPDGQVGEIWVAGPQVTAGYWNDAGASQTVNVRPDGFPPGEERFLRTRDLGFLDDGELFVTGRMDDAILRHGRVLYPQDLERLAQEAHPLLEPGCQAAFSWGDGDRVAMVAGLRKEVGEDEARAVAKAIRTSLWREMDLALDRLELVPRREVIRTSSGKVRRGAMRDALKNGRLTSFWMDADADPPASDGTSLAGPVEDLRSWLEGQLGRGVSLDVDEPLFALGLDSLGLLALAGWLEVRHGQAPPLAMLREGTLGEVSAWVARHSPLSPGVETDRGSPALAPAGDGGRSLGRGEAALLFADMGQWSMVTQTPILLPGMPSASTVKMALADLVRRHPVLGFRVVLGSGGARFLPQDQSEPSLVVLDAQADEAIASLETRLWSSARAPLDPTDGQGVRLVLGPVVDGVRPAVLAIHHLLCDARSLDRLAQELVGLLRGDTFDQFDPPPDPRGREEAALVGPGREEAMDAWRTELDEVPVSVRLPWPAPVPREAAGAFPACRFALSRRLSLAVADRAARLGVGRASLHLAAWWASLVQLGAPSPMAVTFMADIRPFGMNGVGYAVNPLPMVMPSLMEREAEDWSLGDLAKKLNTRMGELLDRRAIPFPNVIEAVDPQRVGGPGPYLQVQFGHGVFTQPLAATLKEALAEGASGFLLPQMEDGSQVNLQVFDTPEGTVGMVVFDPGQIRKETAASLVSSYRAMLEALARDPDTRPGDVDLAFPDPSSMRWEKGAPEPVHLRARRLAVAHPERLAVRDGAVSLDNATLWARVDALAARLVAFGGTPGGLVATLLPRSADLLVAQLAILESGLAVMPMDVAAPPGRVAEILADARPLAVITRDSLPELEGVPTLSVGTETASGLNVRATSIRAVATDDPAFVLHTSGSTGRPKGVVFPHGALSSRLLDLCRRLDVGPGDRVLNYISPAFDPSVQEALMAVTTGATLVVSPEGEGFDPGAVARLMVLEQVTHGVGVPSMLREVVSHPDYMGCRSLRGVTCGGETLTPALRDRLVATSGARLFNVYGATETTICATVWDATDQPPHRVGAVGYPMDDTVVRVLDAKGRPLPPGVIGEIAVGGPALALGYRNRPEETSARYRADPLSSDGGRLYLTGDGGWLDAEGLLWFSGRRDGQVKINGQRVEPGEVEARLRTVPGIKEVVVEPRPKETGEGLELVAYVVAAPQARPSVGRLHGVLVETMPPAQRPIAYCWLEALPLTRNGKVDRARLPVPRNSDRIDAGAIGSPYVEAGDEGDPLERAISSIWSEVLGGAPVPLDANFFNIGGHSLLALRIMTRIEAELGRKVPATSLYAAPTVREFVMLLRREAADGEGALDAGEGPLHRQLRSGGEAPPLFLIAPGTRGEMAFERLAQVLPPGRSVHCLAPPALFDQPAIAHMADLVASYADQVVRLAESAPVHLLGYSIGGLPAHDLAGVLEERGVTVLSLTLVDSLGPRWTWLGRLVLEIMHTLPGVFDRLGRWTGDGRFGELADDRRLLNMLRLARSHSVSRWSGRMTFVGRSRGAWMVRLGAREWLSGTDAVDWVTLPGDHSSLFQEPGVGDLATLLNEVMGSAEERWLEQRTEDRTDHEGK